MNYAQRNSKDKKRPLSNDPYYSYGNSAVNNSNSQNMTQNNNTYDFLRSSIYKTYFPSDYKSMTNQNNNPASNNVYSQGQTKGSRPFDLVSSTINKAYFPNNSNTMANQNSRSMPNTAHSQRTAKGLKPFDLVSSTMNKTYFSSNSNTMTNQNSNLAGNMEDGNMNTSNGKFKKFFNNLLHPKNFIINALKNLALRLMTKLFPNFNAEKMLPATQNRANTPTPAFNATRTRKR